jgi:hypothetical protein
MWRAQGRQHGLERVVQRQQVGDAAAGAQHQHLLALQSVLRQQIQEGLEHAAVGGLVDGGGHDDHVGGLHGLDSGDQRGVAEFGPQNGLGGQVGHLDQAAVTAGGLQLGQGLAQQRRGTGGAGRAARNADDVHGEVRVVRSTGFTLASRWIATNEGNPSWISGPRAVGRFTRAVGAGGSAAGARR